MKKVMVFAIVLLSVAFNGCGGGGSDSNTITINGKTVNVLSSKPNIQEPAQIDIWNNVPDIELEASYINSYGNGQNNVYVVNGNVKCTDYSFSESDLESYTQNQVIEQKFYQKYESGTIHCSQTDFLVNKGKYTLVVVSEIK